MIGTNCIYLINYHPKKVLDMHLMCPIVMEKLKQITRMPRDLSSYTPLSVKLEELNALLINCTHVNDYYMAGKMDLVSNDHHLTPRA